MSHLRLNKARLIVGAFGVALLAALGLWLHQVWRVAVDARAARAAIRSGRLDNATAPLARWLRAQPQSAEAHALMARIALHQGDLGRVTDELNQARTLGLPSSQLERLHAISLSRIGRYQEAEPILTRHFDARSEPDPALDEALARIYMMTHRLPQARSVIEKWMEHAPSDGRPYLWLTELDQRMESANSEVMEKHFREALKRDPDLDAARIRLAHLLRKSYRNADAKREYDRYLARHPDDPEALAGAGRNAFDLHDPEAAIRLLDRALASAPDQPDALKGRAAIDFARGKRADALARLDKVLEADPFDTEALYNRSRVKSALNDEAGAKRDIDAFSRFKKDQAELLRIFTLIMVNPSDNELRAKIAGWMFAHGRYADGLGWAKSVLASDPTHRATNALLADYYAERLHQPGLANFYRLKAATTQPPSP